MGSYRCSFGERKTDNNDCFEDLARKKKNTMSVLETNITVLADEYKTYEAQEDSPRAQKKNDMLTLAGEDIAAFAWLSISI